ncbi:MAG: hypothetical protein FWE34_00855, partial [Defluviitaleaceae bacterium]|nr:hypothetical protein [Defluviitaleaceae bacterium]
YFDFETGILSPADWWRFNKNETWSAFIPDPNNPRIWYVSSTLGGHGSHQVGFEERSYIRRLDFENKTMEPIISVTEIHVTLMSVGANGELVFAYSGQSGTGFAVFYRGAN